jgi:hypothetical protein
VHCEKVVVSWPASCAHCVKVVSWDASCVHCAKVVVSWAASCVHCVKVVVSWAASSVHCVKVVSWAASKRCSSLFFSNQASLPNFSAALAVMNS